MRLFEARSILEDLAVIARLKRLGVRGDSVFHRDNAETSRKEIEEVTSGGAIRLCALDSLAAPPANSHHRRLVRDHLRDLEQVRNSVDVVMRDWDSMSSSERGALLARLAKQVLDVAEGLESVKGFAVLNSVTAEDINEIVMKHRLLIADYIVIAEAIKGEASELGARHKSLPPLLETILAIERMAAQHVLFGPKPLHGEKAYEEWTASVRISSVAIDEAKALLEQLSAANVWAAG